MYQPPKTGLSDNMIAAIAYFTPAMAVFFLAIHRYNKRPYVRFHAWQSLLFNVFALALGYVLVFAVPYFKFLGPHVLTVLLCVALAVAFLLWLWCVISAANGKRFRLPIIGDWADQQAYR